MDDGDGSEMGRDCLSLFVLSIGAKGTEALGGTFEIFVTRHPSPSSFPLLIIDRLSICVLCDRWLPISQVGFLG